MRRYNNIPIINSPDGKKMYTTVRYPEVPRTFEDTYVHTTDGDRFDTLAQQFYNDSSLWWIISIANEGLKQNSLNPPVGSQIRIPANPTPIIAEFKEINE